MLQEMSYFDAPSNAGCGFARARSGRIGFGDAEERKAAAARYLREHPEEFRPAVI